MFTNISQAIAHARAMRSGHEGRHYGLRQRKNGSIAVDKAHRINRPMWSTKSDSADGKKRHDWTVIEPDDVPLILELVTVEGISRASVARKFYVSPSLIESIVKNRRWKRPVNTDEVAA
ncbi:hypothetical protein IM876_09270 [Serratia plymuthica]|uniref:hypothetical protein n=1 Tax=Serratia plymuthica TaxID=82996 RepID=UPI0019270D39|nr:hypothetical protein [Serratia plymuthica]MBL3522852.1 hypothetical protein [Serratia plymuthica]